MKFALRRPTDAPEPVDDNAPPPPPTPPRGRPVAAYAAVDGRSLWLAVDAGPGTLGLRDEAGTVVPLRSAVADEQPGYLSARVDLDELFSTAEDTAAYDAVLVSGGDSAKAVWSHPLPAESKVCARVSADGTHVWDVSRLADGTLQVVRVPQAPSVCLRAIELEGETVTVATDPVPGADPNDGPELRLADLEGNVVLTRAMTLSDDGLLRATLSLDDLPPGDEVWPRVHVGDLPVRRRDNDLVKAQQATLLPMLFGDDPETPVLRFRFAPDGMLGLRIAARTASRQEAGA